MRSPPERVRRILLLGFVVVLVGCSHPDENSIKCTVEEYARTVFAEWGKDESGKRWEDRFDGVKVKLESGNGVETAWLVQPWSINRGCSTPPVKLPEVGETFYLRSLPENSRVLPIDEQSYWYCDLDRIQ